MQSTIGLTVIIGYAAAGLDPLVQLFFYAGTGGGLGVLLLLTLAAVAIVAHFIRRPSLDTTWQTRWAPILATVALAVMVVLAVTNFATLLGVDPTSPLRWAIPVAYPAAALLGLVWALVLRCTRPDVYAGIGLGADAATARTATPTAPALGMAPASTDSAAKPPYTTNPSYPGRGGSWPERP
jgi:amino acid transporter